ncbi:MAG: hypothetical protein IIA17_04900, partial [candidate division Zixibacteria bacterium]|nr:hypothetical protein [candidate division Zixibacteria bacterium]
VAMGSLAFVVLTSGITYSKVAEVLAYYIPRLSFIVFIEVFAYFFLKLYKASLYDIKFYQNELTNVESKIISLKSAFFSKDDGALRTIIEELSRTERNFVLKKGETTVELERTRLDTDRTKEALKSMQGLLNLNKQK